MKYENLNVFPCGMVSVQVVKLQDGTANVSRYDSGDVTATRSYSCASNKDIPGVVKQYLKDVGQNIYGAKHYMGTQVSGREWLYSQIVTSDLKKK